MQYLKNKDKKRRNLVLKYELKRKVLKMLTNNQNLMENVRYNTFFQLLKLPQDSNRIRIKNRCTITNRAKSVDRFSKISRISFRNLSASGELSGIRKASW